MCFSIYNCMYFNQSTGCRHSNEGYLQRISNSLVLLSNILWLIDVDLSFDAECPLVSLSTACSPCCDLSLQYGVYKIGVFKCYRNISLVFFLFFFLTTFSEVQIFLHAGTNSIKTPCLDAHHSTHSCLSILNFWSNVQLHVDIRWMPGAAAPFDPPHSFHVSSLQATDYISFSSRSSGTCVFNFFYFIE